MSLNHVMCVVIMITIISVYAGGPGNQTVESLSEQNLEQLQAIQLALKFLKTHNNDKAIEVLTNVVNQNERDVKSKAPTVSWQKAVHSVNYVGFYGNLCSETYD